MNKEKIRSLLIDAIYRNILVYDQDDKNGIFTPRLARLLIYNCNLHNIIPKMFIVPANNSGFQFFEGNDVANIMDAQYPQDNNYTMYRRIVHFMPEHEYNELFQIYKDMNAILYKTDNNFCLCGNEEKALLGSF